MFRGIGSPIDFVLDRAEIPVFQEIASFDANGNGQPDAAETTPYHAAKCESLRSDLDLRVDGQSAMLAVSSSSIEFPPGAGGLPTFRLTCTFPNHYHVKQPICLSGTTRILSDLAGCPYHIN